MPNTGVPHEGLPVKRIERERDRERERERERERNRERQRERQKERSTYIYIYIYIYIERERKMIGEKESVALRNNNRAPDSRCLPKRTPRDS